MPDLDMCRLASSVRRVGGEGGGGDMSGVDIIIVASCCIPLLPLVFLCLGKQSLRFPKAGRGSNSKPQNRQGRGSCCGKGEDLLEEI